MDRPKLPDNAKLVFKGMIFDVYQWEQDMYDGSKHTFERLKRPDTVQIIPVLEDGIVINYEEQPATPPYIGFPGGRVDGDESPLEAAKREMLEETGLASDDVIPWFTFSPHSKLIWTIHYFIARNAKKIQEPHVDAGEKISTKMISFDEFVALPLTPEHESFRGGGLINEILLQAYYDPKKKEELRLLLSPAKE